MDVFGEYVFPALKKFVVFVSSCSPI